MKIAYVLFLASITLCSCSTVQKQNDRNEAEDELLHAAISLKILNALNSNDLAAARNHAEPGILENAPDLSDYFIHGHLGPGLKGRIVEQERAILDYLIQNREDLAKRKLQAVRSAVYGLQKVLTTPEDVRKLQELSDYLASVQRKGVGDDF